MAITAAQLRAFAPGASAKIVDGIVANQKFLVSAGITTPLRVQHFFAQVANETGGLAHMEENLSYSAQRLCQVWPNRFKSMAAAEPYAHNPTKLAEKVYGGRLGNKSPGDGWKYRGSGLLQDTGRSNFAEVEKETGLPVIANPDLLRTLPGALQAACLYWDKRGINKHADADDITAVTKAVNGGLIGIADRKAWLAKAKKVWGGKATSKPASALQVVQAPSPVIEPKPSPAPVPVTDKELIRRVQTGLKLLNYNPGGDDGVIGPLTAGAIRIFRADNGLPEGDFIDDALIAALASAKPREMIASRANATSTVVATIVPEAKAHWYNKWGAAAAGIPAAAAGAADYIAPARGYIDQVRDMFADVPSYVWFILIAVLCGILFWNARRGEQASVEAFKSGDRR